MILDKYTPGYMQMLTARKLVWEWDLSEFWGKEMLVGREEGCFEGLRGGKKSLFSSSQPLETG